MRFAVLFCPLALISALSNSLGEPIPSSLQASVREVEEHKWELSLSTATYFVQDGRDFVNPTFTADRDWLHLEARFNYESLNTGSLWLGYNFGFGEKLAFEITPMLGGVFGDFTGLAPGYSISVSYKMFEFSTQGEYFIDDTAKENNFFYTWSELSCSPADWFRFGLVVDRTKVLGEDIDIRRGPLIGLHYRKLDLTTYWLDPGSSNETFILSVSLNY
jgi:hypothetical protein